MKKNLYFVALNNQKVHPRVKKKDKNDKIVFNSRFQELRVLTRILQIKTNRKESNTS